MKVLLYNEINPTKTHGFKKIKAYLVHNSEMQDLTNIQMQLILKSLRDPADFILCGDSNQVVHPNFISWSKIKSFFYKQEGSASQTDLTRILNTNYRNSPQVTEVANLILKIKSTHFDSIDKESSYLVKSNAHNTWEVILLRDEEANHDFNAIHQRHIERFAENIKRYTERGYWNELY
ncbi:MAG: hypothetical protein GY814_10295 [Gammaproteobacteria bacterium]|nr:hypothetical protein [Gammaproteobacteria bacterium]